MEPHLRENGKHLDWAFLGRAKAVRRRNYYHPSFYQRRRILTPWGIVPFLAILLLAILYSCSQSADLRWVDGCDKCDGTSPVEAYRLAGSFRGHWLRFGLQCDSLFWPLGQRVVLALKDGSQVPSVMVMGVGPLDSHGRPVRLGIVSRWLHQDELEQGHRGRGGLVLAAFPESSMTSRIVAVRLERGTP